LSSWRPNAQLTRQQVKDYLNISESTYKPKVKDGTLKSANYLESGRFYLKDLLGCQFGKASKEPYLTTPALPVVYPLLLPS